MFSIATSGPRRPSYLENDVAIECVMEAVLGGRVLFAPLGMSSFPFVGFKFFAALSTLLSFDVSKSDLIISVLIFASYL